MTNQIASVGECFPLAWIAERVGHVLDVEVDELATVEPPQLQIRSRVPALQMRWY
jgi:hypothetical protein